MHFTIYIAFSDSAGNQLIILSAKVQYDNHFSCQTVFLLGIFENIIRDVSFSGKHFSKKLLVPLSGAVFCAHAGLHADRCVKNGFPKAALSRLLYETAVLFTWFSAAATAGTEMTAAVIKASVSRKL